MKCPFNHKHKYKVAYGLWCITCGQALDIKAREEKREWKAKRKKWKAKQDAKRAFR